MAVTYQEKLQLRTQAQQKKSVFPIRMFLVVKLDGVLVEEDASGFFKGNAMFP
jgi:hypothetical protein